MRFTSGPRRTLPALTTTLCLGGLVVTLAACSSSGSSTTASTPPARSTASSPSTQSSSPSTRSSSSGGSSTQQIDAVCASTLSKIKAVPTPSGPTDLPGVKRYFTADLALFQAYEKAITPLVDASPNAAQLKAKWLSVEVADFAVVQPLIEKAITAAAAGDQATVSSVVAQLGKVPDHSAAIAAYLRTQGLTSCATLQNA